jgi:hypothetical protein
MQRRAKQCVVIGAVVAVTAVVLPASFAIGAGPVRFADGQPGDDSRLSVLTPAEAAFVQRKLAMAAQVTTGGSGPAQTSAGEAPAIACEFDPCEPAPPPPTRAPSATPTPAATPSPTAPPPPAPPTAKSLATRARQQNNYYFCGPASGQVVINWSRGIINGNNDGEDATTNWRRQSKVAEWMGTTTAGTGGANLAAGLNNPSAVLKPTSDWIYIYADNGTTQALYQKIVTDIAMFSMPLVLATAPHISGAGVYYLESWPKVAAGAHHWIVLRGYDGAWGNPSAISIKYQDSSAGYGGATGAFDDSLAVIWQVSKWNQGGHVVW